MNAPTIDSALVERLVASQFPQWAALPIRKVEPGGNDNRTFRLGDDLLVRLPSHERYVAQVEKEQAWLPRLAPQLPVEIPRPIARGEADAAFPWPWSVYGWLEGEPALDAAIPDRTAFARQVADFLVALQRADPAGAPGPGLHNFFRGGSLAVYDEESRAAIRALEGRLDGRAATAVWEDALAATWHGDPVWVHGDVAFGNLLVRDGQLAAVLDFGCAAVGDPACDLVIAWTFFSGEARRVFRETIGGDPATWKRARGWALWKALILLASNDQRPEHGDSAEVVDAALLEHARGD